MSSGSTFGKDPEGLDRLFAVGIQRSGVAREALPTASLGQFMERPGGWIGRYKLLSVLGEGGMGVVYLAQQERPIRRQVALKVIKPGMDSKRVIARFEVERQALALLDHPNIAQVYDAGTTEAGRPYFVMEYVKGPPITEYCDKHKLTIDERLRLFQQVCYAIQHAHQKGIIHRDIKSSNVLVSLQDDRAVPKMIDFGVAKATAAPLTERTLFTEQGRWFGTPEYMSPEQADMATEDIDTRSDVYSLGVLLYVLLTGALPFDSAAFRQGGLDRIRQMIREIDPKTPSTRLTKLGDRAETVAQNRRTAVKTLAKRLHRELEWIPLKAMRKERTERYQSASELAVDVENYLNGAALIAGPLGAVYRLSKFVQRNRAAVIGVAAVVAVLVGGVVVSTLFAFRAEQKARTAHAVSDFLTDSVLSSVDPVSGDQPGTSLESILGVASQRLEGKFIDEPLIEASIRYRLGRTYWHLGKHEAAETNLKRAFELRKGKLGMKDPEVLRYMQELAWVYFHQSRYDQAELLLVEAVSHMQHVLDEFDPPLPQATIRLGWLYRYQGKYKEAEKVFAERLAACRRRWGPDHPALTASMEGLGVAYLGQGRLAEAEQLCRKAVEISRRARGEEHGDTLNYMRWLGAVYCASGRYEEAETLFLKALEVRRRVLGEENPRTLILMRHLGSLYGQMGRFDEAEQFLVSALERHRRLLGNEDQETLHSMVEVGKLYRAQGHHEKAEPLLLAAFHGREATLGPKHPHTIESLRELVTLCESWGKPNDAAKWRSKLTQREDVGERD